MERYLHSFARHLPLPCQWRLCGCREGGLSLAVGRRNFAMPGSPWACSHWRFTWASFLCDGRDSKSLAVRCWRGSCGWQRHRLVAIALVVLAGRAAEVWAAHAATRQAIKHRHRNLPDHPSRIVRRVT
jgi:hypothetical protein